jgi:hypothetical protein
MSISYLNRNFISHCKKVIRHLTPNIALYHLEKRPSSYYFFMLCQWPNFSSDPSYATHKNSSPVHQEHSDCPSSSQMNQASQPHRLHCSVNRIRLLVLDRLGADAGGLVIGKRSLTAGKCFAGISKNSGIFGANSVAAVESFFFCPPALLCC